MFVEYPMKDCLSAVSTYPKRK